MSKLDADWRENLMRRFSGRENLNKEELFARYFEQLGCPKTDVLECLNLIEVEYEIPAGVLRPEDKLEKLLTPVPTKSPWRWLVYRTREGDSGTEIYYELGKRLQRFDTVQAWSHIEKFGDLSICELIEAWCGHEPVRK